MTMAYFSTFMLASMHHFLPTANYFSSKLKNNFVLTVVWLALQVLITIIHWQ